MKWISITLLMLAAPAAAQHPTPTTIWIAATNNQSFGLEVGARAAWFGLAFATPDVGYREAPPEFSSRPAPRITTEVAFPVARYGVMWQVYWEPVPRLLTHATVGAYYKITEYALVADGVYYVGRGNEVTADAFALGGGVGYELAPNLMVGVQYTTVQGVGLRVGWQGLVGGK